MTQTLSCNVNNDALLGANNDIYLDQQGNISVTYDLYAVLEQCSQVAKTLLGELVFNTDLGVPYFETVWVGVPNIAQFNASMRQSFLNVNGVLEVISLLTFQGSDDSPSDRLTYTSIIRTTFGTGAING